MEVAANETLGHTATEIDESRLESTNNQDENEKASKDVVKHHSSSPSEPEVATKTVGADYHYAGTSFNAALENKDYDEPLVDKTEALPLRSKKTDRLKKRLEKKTKKKKGSGLDVKSFLDLPVELLHEIFSHLRPRDILGSLLLLNRSTKTFIEENETSLARDICARRYWVLSQCFHLPVPLQEVPPKAIPSLLSPQRQQLLTLHRKPYHHIVASFPEEVCTCMTCVFAWNNLCMVLDFAHWQPYLNDREPIPMIPRGSMPEWNTKLLEANGAVVKHAMKSPLTYARILEKHLDSITGTLMRPIRYNKKISLPNKNRLYNLTSEDVEKGTDGFLDRKGPPSYEPPWHRDNYYSLECYVPNRKWDKEELRWKYWPAQHRRDLEWIMERF
ncbi:hypothetical protein MBLNU230_g7185t1 [Neophaeotheca triangularis]